MAILQENRFDAQSPKVSKTEYGAEYVEASTETPVDDKEPIDLDGNNQEESADVVEDEVSIAPVVGEKKKAGRPKKSNKSKK